MAKEHDASTHRHGILQALDPSKLSKHENFGRRSREYSSRAKQQQQVCKVKDSREEIDFTRPEHLFPLSSSCSFHTFEEVTLAVGEGDRSFKTLYVSQDNDVLTRCYSQGQLKHSPWLPNYFHSVCHFGSDPKVDALANESLELIDNGTLLGFDDYVNMVLEDVTEFDYSGNHTKLSKILLNGNNICMLIPGGEGPVEASS
ncbi:hypothetical protein G7Y89_g8239 [Cudoniella acicularis]|uniref:LSM complex subunit LSM5 n=1 Tax=Cudoniella acicularis TaxID=354080 RepID=A0A8H4W198_9HELO|nr:hypothetical protein G7Y89_g8239 [Cudoniella acicularis]